MIEDSDPVRDSDDFERDGAICLRGVVDPDWIERLRAATEWALEHPLGMEFGADSAARYYAELFPWRRHPEFKEFCLSSGIADVVRRLTGSADVRLFYDYLLVKEPGGSPATPWHQDQPYLPATGTDVCSVWVALDEVTSANGGLEYVQGSHRWGKVLTGQSIQSGFDRSDLEAVPDIDANRLSYRLLSWELRPGDCVVHHSLTLHGGPPNTSQHRRRGLAVRWLYGEVRFAPLPNTSPQVAEVAREAGLEPGDEFRGPLFPAPE
jgi:ectoine hydroxylase-related dioxygenase (phytanoyl-CoA dioxygenase family)